MQKSGAKNEKMPRKDEDTEKNARNLSSLSFSLVMLIVGLPIWWKTTQVYRVDLPYDRIEALNSSTIILPITINAIYVEDSDRPIIERVISKLSENLSQKFIHDRLNLSYKFILEKISLNNMKILEIAKSIEEFDERFVQSNNKNLHILFLSDHSPSLKTESKDFRVYYGTKNTFFVRKFPADELTLIVEKILTEIYVVSSKLTEIARKHFDKRMSNSRVKKLLPADQQGQKTERISNTVTGGTGPGKFLQPPNVLPEYTVEFSVIVPQPDEPTFANLHNNNGKSGFNQKKIFQDDFRPFARRLRNLTDLKFTSQFIYHVDFDVKPKKFAGNLSKNGEILSKNTENSSSFYYFYDSEQLPHLISHLETYTTVFESDRKTLRFLIYVTPRSKRPLYITDETGENRIEENGFMVTSWGGIVIFNPKNDENSPFTIDSQVQNVLFSQLRVLMGFNVQPLADGHVRCKDPLPDWQLQTLTYESALDYCLGTIATLNSLTKLLAEITNIVINEEVGVAINEAVISTESALRLLAGNYDAASNSDVRAEDDVIIEAYRLATLARQQSERAFFDQSLLALLYFPEDQKYAIYVPLFLPVGLPILLSIFPFIKLLKMKKKS